LNDDDVLRLVDVEDRHPVDRARLVGARRRVGHVVRADHQRDVGALEVVVDLLHVDRATLARPAPTPRFPRRHAPLP
jgi:hypothetical protein